MVMWADKTPVVAMRLENSVTERFDVGNVPKASVLNGLLEVAVEVCHLRRNGC